MDVWAEPQHQAAVMEGLLEDVQQTAAFEHSPWGPASLCLFLQGTSQGTRAVLPSATLAQPQVCPQVPASTKGRTLSQPLGRVSDCWYLTKLTIPPP